MTGTTLDVDTSSDGSLIIQPHGALRAEDAVDLRRVIVHAVRHVRPRRLILDLSDLRDVDPINLGTLAAACHLGDDQCVDVFLDNSSVALADQLTAAGVDAHHLRRVGIRHAA
ncbi:STAS domain-containing protein [Actinoplanes sp. NPDC051346]|uniref:STAS domain-containing protein n=1 Tax=Actinoplanes sp. NPDC051346 TaxID=3155048 RepID=UPI0034240F83